MKRDFEEIIQQRRGIESFEKRSEKEEESVTLEQIKIITDLLEKAPRSTVINFGATEELVSVIDKAAVLMNQMHEMAFGKKQREDKLEEMLLKVFREINAKVGNISERLDQLEGAAVSTDKKEKKNLINLPEKKQDSKEPEVQGEDEEKTPVRMESSPRKRRKYRRKDSEIKDGQVTIKGYTFEGIPYTVSDKGIAAFSWKDADDQEEVLKKALIQLQEQGVDTSNTFALKEAGFETIYTKFRNLGVADRNWRQWISSWHGK